MPPATPDMTLDDADEFIRQARELGWTPRIVLVGGEPTLHPQFYDFMERALAFSDAVSLISNGFSSAARKAAEEAARRGVEVWWDSFKPSGSVVHSVRDIFVAPVDVGMEGRSPCAWHAGVGQCGISVDACGYSVCAIGGTIDGVLGLGVRTKRLADLWIPEKAAEQTRALCRMCGKGLGLDRVHPDRCKKRFGISLSSTWQEAFERLRPSAKP